jgi:hypothetical protein
MLRTNAIFCRHRNEIIARLKEDFEYETQLPLTGPVSSYTVQQSFGWDLYDILTEDCGNKRLKHIGCK